MGFFLCAMEMNKVLVDTLWFYFQFLWSSQCKIRVCIIHVYKFHPSVSTNQMDLFPIENTVFTQNLWCCFCIHLLLWILSYIVCYISVHSENTGTYWSKNKTGIWVRFIGVLWEPDLVLLNHSLMSSYYYSNKMKVAWVVLIWMTS